MTTLDLQVRLAKIAASVVRATGRGGGTSLPGKLLLRMQPDAIAALSARLGHGSAII